MVGMTMTMTMAATNLGQDNAVTGGAEEVSDEGEDDDDVDCDD